MSRIEETLERGLAQIAEHADGTWVWTANTSTEGEGNLTRIDPATGVGTNVALLQPDTHPGEMAFDGTHLWFLVTDNHAVSRVDPNTGIGENIPLPDGAQDPSSVTFDGTSIWVSIYATNNAVQIDPATSTANVFSLPRPHAARSDSCRPVTPCGPSTSTATTSLALRTSAPAPGMTRT